MIEAQMKKAEMKKPSIEVNQVFDPISTEDMNELFNKSHIILLIQPDVNPETRTFETYDCVYECMEGVLQICYDYLLKTLGTTSITSITCEMQELFSYIDQLPDLGCLVFQTSTNLYAPYNKDWIKDRIYASLRYIGSRSD